MPVDTLQTVKDPVCGMDVEPRKAADRREVGGQTWYFCSKVCSQSFDEEPRRYLDKQVPKPG